MALPHRRAETSFLGLADVADKIRALDLDVLDAARRVPRADETPPKSLLNQTGRRLIGPRVSGSLSEAELALGAGLLFLVELSYLEPEGRAENTQEVERMMRAYLSGREESAPAGLLRCLALRGRRPRTRGLQPRRPRLAHACM